MTEKQIGTVEKQLDKIQTALKNIIDQEGFRYLQDHALEVYEEFPDKTKSDQRLSRIVYMTLLAGIPQCAEKGESLAVIQQKIRRDCCLEDPYPELLAQMYHNLLKGEGKEKAEKH